MNIAVTGATGFLGRYIVNHLIRAGHRCRCWYRPHSDRGGFVDAASQLDWLSGELGDVPSAQALVDGVDAVIHGALAPSGGAGVAQYAQVNLIGSLQLMQAARAAGVGRFIFISTCSVHDIILDDRNLDEAHPLWPTGHYGAYKAAVEKFVHSYGFGEGWPICSLRPTGIYGLARPVHNSRWFGLVKRIVSGEDFASAAGGKEVHAQDVAKAVHALIDADESAIVGQAFNCYDRYVAEQDVAQIAKAISGGANRIDMLNKGPKHQIDTSKIRALGMTFGGEALLRQTVGELVEAVTR